MPLQPQGTVATSFVADLQVTLVRKVAEGGMGSLYEAVLHGPQGFEKTVALKTIVERFSQDEHFVELFIGEAKLVADLVHQNICQVYQLGRVGQRYFIAMEFISGVNLRQFLRRHAETGRSLPPELAVFITSRICRGLEYAHSKRDKNGLLLGVVHRDVGPHNVMVSTEGEVKLTDFGVAKARTQTAELQDEQVRVGKAEYMSPEQVRLETTDARSDLFSVGAVMFELLTGQRLFTADTARQARAKVLEREIPRPRSLNPTISEGVEEVLLRTLQRDPAARYQTAGELGTDLEYQIYHQGYGPTIVTLEKHMRGLFPELFVPAGRRRAPSKPATLIIDSVAGRAERSDVTARTVVERKGQG
jgi:eukaryotic-like serine/threonine-protein kinase